MPPIEMAQPGAEDIQALRRRANIQPGQRIIGMAVRLATEKGVEYLVEALPLVLAKHPTARVLVAGPYQNIIGEEAYARRLLPSDQQLGDHWTFLGALPPAEHAAFFQQCELTVLPSINSTEFVWHGPGRIDVVWHARGCFRPARCPHARDAQRHRKDFPSANAAALAQAIIEILDQPRPFRGHPEQLLYNSRPEQTALAYEKIFHELLAPYSAPGTSAPRTLGTTMRSIADTTLEYGAEYRAPIKKDEV